MEALTQETLAWARSIGLSPDRVAFLAACPKFTVCGEHMKHRKNIEDNPNHHLQKLGSRYWFRLRRGGKDIFHNIAGDVDTARKLRDEMLAAYHSGKPIPYLNTRA